MAVHPVSFLLTTHRQLKTLGSLSPPWDSLCREGVCGTPGKRDSCPEHAGPSSAPPRAAGGHPAIPRGSSQHEQLLCKEFMMDSATQAAVSKAAVLSRAGKEKLATARVSRAPCPPPSLSDVDADELSRGNFEVGFRPQKSVKAEREEQPEAGEHGPQGGGPEAVARLPRPKEGGPATNPGPAELQSCSPGWCSAFYEADCFGADVHSYVQELARQKAGGAADADAQSLVSPGLRPGAGGGVQVPHGGRQWGMVCIEPLPVSHSAAPPTTSDPRWSGHPLHVWGRKRLLSMSWACGRQVTVAGGDLVLGTTAEFGPCLQQARQVQPPPPRQPPGSWCSGSSTHRDEENP